MTPLMPTSYAAYVNKKSSITNDKAKKILHIFPYRYRFARAFTGVNAPEVGKTIAGYEAGLKVMLAYSAYETVHKAARILNAKKIPHIKQDLRESVGIANAIRKNERLRHLLITNTDGKNLLQLLTDCFAGKNNDVICVACGIRNAFVHGAFTAGGAGISTKSSKAAMESVANEVLDYCDEIFTRCVAAL